MEADPRSKEQAKEQERKHQQQIFESFHTGPFEAIVARAEASARHRNRLDEILNISPSHPQPSLDRDTLTPGWEERPKGLEPSDDEDQDKQSIPVHEMQFPELFVY